MVGLIYMLGSVFFLLPDPLRQGTILVALGLSCSNSQLLHGSLRSELDIGFGIRIWTCSDITCLEPRALPLPQPPLACI